MRDFFHGWRRKTGVVTLVMALAFMGGWLRSLMVQDSFSLPYALLPTLRLVSLEQSLVGLLIEDPTSMLMLQAWESSPPTDQPFYDHPGIEWRLKLFGFGIGDELFDPANGGHVSLWVIPYWSIVITLTLFSAYLLLGNPSSPHPKAAVPTVTVEGP